MGPIIKRRTTPDPGINVDFWGAEGDPPCPDGDPQRPCEILGFRLKGADLLQLRVALRDSDNGVCHAAVEEGPDRIGVRAVACMSDEQPSRRASCDLHETDCPITVPLSAPLAARSVIDLDTGEPLPLFIPRWDTDEPSEYVPRPPGNLWPPDN